MRVDGYYLPDRYLLMPPPLLPAALNISRCWRVAHFHEIHIFLIICERRRMCASASPGPFQCSHSHPVGPRATKGALVNYATRNFKLIELIKSPKPCLPCKRYVASEHSLKSESDDKWRHRSDRHRSHRGQDPSVTFATGRVEITARSGV